MDDLYFAAQPRCPNDGTVMRDSPGAWVCGSCGHRIEQPPVLLPPDFDGPDLDHRR